MGLRGSSNALKRKLCDVTVITVPGFLPPLAISWTDVFFSPVNRSTSGKFSHTK